MAGLPTVAAYPLPTRAHLPDNHARWRPDPARAVLLVHDMQNYFVRALPQPLRADLVRNVAALRSRCATAGVPVVYTAQPGRMTDQQRGLLKDFWGPGMRTEPADREVVAELAPDPGDRVLTKWRYSAFVHTDLLDHLRAQDRDQIIVCGVYAYVGVLATALDAFNHDIQPFLVADALGDFSAADHALALRYAARRCAVVSLTEEMFP